MAGTPQGWSPIIAFANTLKMELYDVGMHSLAVVEADSLAELAQVLGRPEDFALAH